LNFSPSERLAKRLVEVTTPLPFSYQTLVLMS